MEKSVFVMDRVSCVVELPVTEHGRPEVKASKDEIENLELRDLQEGCR